MKYWLMKCEPDTYSIDDLKKDKKTYWDGVRNYQARNFLRDSIQVGDGVLFYHSNAEPSGVVGVAKVCKAGYADFTAWDKKDIHYDPKSSESRPQWYMVDVAFEEKFKHFIPLDEIKANPALKDMLVIKRGMRLSVQPVEKKHFDVVCEMGRK
jgi:predicted RNA-binding protein with PUA-like domain